MTLVVEADLVAVVVGVVECAVEVDVDEVDGVNGVSTPLEIKPMVDTCPRVVMLYDCVCDSSQHVLDPQQNVPPDVEHSHISGLPAISQKLGQADDVQFLSVHVPIQNDPFCHSHNPFDRQ